MHDRHTTVPIQRRSSGSLVVSQLAFALGIIWWACFFPGFYSGDSFAGLNEAVTQRISTSYTAVWPLYLTCITVRGRFPALATLVDVLVLVYAFRVWCRAALPLHVADRAHTLMTATPLIGAMGITLWHDIPMTSGFLLLAGVTTSTNWFSVKLTPRDYVHLVAGSALSAFRPNGLPTLACFFGLAVIWRGNFRQTSRYGLIGTLTALFISIAASLATGNMSLINAHYAQEWMRADISCLLSQNVALVDPANRETLSRIGGVEAWTNSAGCQWLNHLPIAASQLRQSLEVVPAMWVNTALAHPIRTARIHAERHAYLLPVPRTRAFNTPFIHSSIEFPDRGIAWANPRLSQTLRSYVRVWNAARGLLAFAGLWLAVLAVLGVAARSVSFRLEPTILLSLCLVVLLFITAPIPDARYALFVLVTGQSALLGALLGFVSKRPER